MVDWKRRPRPAFLVALGCAALAWWLAGEPTTPTPATVVAAPPAPPAIVDTLNPGQTLSGVWSEHALDPEDLTPVVEASMNLFPWRSLRPGAVYKFTFRSDGRLDGLDLKIDRDRRLVIRRAGIRFSASLEETQFARGERSISACVEGSLWETISAAGEDPSLAVLMAEALAAQVDFYNDLRAGDCVGAAFTADVRPDGTYKLVSLEAVRFDGERKSHEAYRFSADGVRRQDWYDADGQSLKRRFLRSPLKFSRISSRFGTRMHPILRRARHHDGVDYVAPKGTPVQASGDGMVRFAGRRGGYGLHVELKHGREYVTSYSHLSRIASGVRSGSQVSQGQVIGYVGSTGMSTGAHLHYRFIKDGRNVDPLSTDLPTGVPLEGEELARFMDVRDGMRGRIASAGDGPDGGVAPARQLWVAGGVPEGHAATDAR
ncbi:MAG: peptidoglycan DD-metalloendopeptidase family protein [Gemmatimonadota bacterium]